MSTNRVRGVLPVAGAASAEFRRAENLDMYSTPHIEARNVLYSGLIDKRPPTGVHSASIQRFS